MGAIGLNPIRLDRIGLDPIRINAIKLGVPGASGTDRPYIDPEVLASLKAVCICYGKSNDDPDRAVVKNLVDPDNPFVISNAAYDKMSSYGGYEFAKFDNTLDWYNTEGNDSVEVVSRNGHSITLKRLTGPNFWYFQNSTFRGLISNVIPFKVNSNKNITVIWDVHGLSISEGKDKSVRVQELVLNPNEDNYTNLKTLNEEELAQIDISTNSLYYLLWFDLSTLAVDEEVTIEMLPLFEGAFVTDGIDDLITSTKTVQEMLGGSNEITVVSLITHISGTGKYNIIGDGGIQVSDYSGQTFMAGTSSSGEKIVELGDKEKLQAVQYTTFDSKLTIGLEDSSYAYYGTFVFNKENVPVDWIHQVIAYFNLDRTLKSDIYCNIAKQGITNENHAEFGDKLIDFSGNGRDIQLNNIAWKGDSDIGKYEVDFASLNYNNTTSVFTATYKSCSISKIIKDGVGNIFYNWGQTLAAINSTKIQVIGLDEIGAILEFTYLDESGNSTTKQYSTDGIYDLPASAAYQGDSHNTNFRFSIRGYIGDCDITITQIPSHAGALCLDGINDFGKVTGMPIYKDYTFIIDYERISYASSEKWVAGVVSKSHVANQGAFILMTANTKVEPGKQAYSFGGVTSFNRDDFTRALLYQSKYKCGDVDLTVGEGVDSNTLWLGTFRDNDQKFFNGAIYSLMSFPYSMNKFLIERQLKKHKLGTLYPNMVEFRPVIKSSVELASKPTFVIRGTSTLLNTGDYIPENSEIWVVITMNNAADRITKFVINGNTIDIPSSAYNPSTMKYGFPFTIDSKSPQKITMTIEQDENYVQWNPVVTSNVEYNKLDFYLNNYQKRINVGDYIPKDAYVRANFYLKNNVDELTVFTFNGVNIDYKRSVVDDTAFNIGAIYNYDSPQEVNITVDEYIRYEDIVQPYPSFVKLENLDRTYTYTWGDKLKVGDTIRYNSSVNLLEGAYTLKGQLECNGVYVYDNNQYITVAKEMIFAWTNSPIWSIDDNEPKCILSPRLLRIPNSSYKILGYIPDISGHGNHGKINNSAYAEGSGVNEDGSYQFDGVDDFITIPTTVGGKQVLMKVNWQSIAGTAILYDQRTNGGFAIFNRDFDTNENKVPAYRARNIGGSTYIDGILNKYIYASELKNITHNIVELHDPKLDIGTLNPKIGSSYLNSNYTQMSLYDFMLFDEISTDDKIKELNKYVGIEGNVWGILTQLSNSTLISNETLIKNE